MGAGAALRMLRHVPRYCEVQVLLLVGDTWQAEGGTAQAAAPTAAARHAAVSCNGLPGFTT